MGDEEKMHTPTLSTEVIKLSESISKPLERLFQVGGLALVFIFVGFLSMLVGYLNKTDLSGWFFGIGALIVFACLCLFMFSQFYVIDLCQYRVNRSPQSCRTVANHFLSR